MTCCHSGAVGTHSHRAWSAADAHSGQLQIQEESLAVSKPILSWTFLLLGSISGSGRPTEGHGINITLEPRSSNSVCSGITWGPVLRPHVNDSVKFS